LLWTAAIFFVVVLAAIIEGIVSQSTNAFGHFGIGFLWSTAFNTVTNQYGAGPFILGTVVITAIAMLIAVPVGLATASFLTEMCPRRIATPLGVGIDLIAAVPSIVVGLWGLFVLQPVFLRDVEAVHAEDPGGQAPLQGGAEGPSLFLAGFVLSIMILPTMVALSRTALAGVGNLDREAAFALGATPWQVIRKVVVPGANSGILAAATLALGAPWARPSPSPSSSVTSPGSPTRSRSSTPGHAGLDHRAQLRGVRAVAAAEEHSVRPGGRLAGHHLHRQRRRPTDRPQEQPVPAPMSTDLLEAPAPSGKDPAVAQRRQQISSGSPGEPQTPALGSPGHPDPFGTCMVLTLVPLVALVGYVSQARCRGAVGRVLHPYPHA